jgi:prolipoprotein diacylglyceryltransferase
MYEDLPSMNLYALFIGLGASLGMWRVTQKNPGDQELPSAYTALLVLAGALLGARIGFFFWQPGYIAEFGWKALQIWEGGLIWPGALLGAWLSMGLLALFRKKDFRSLCDQMTPLLLPLAVMTWLACISSGSAYGAKISQDFHLPLLPDERGGAESRIPNQWLAAIFLLIAFMILEKRLETKSPGVYSALSWLVMSVHTLIFSLFRADPRPQWLGLALDIWAAFFFLAFSLLYLLLVVLMRNEKKKERAGLAI